MPLPGATYPRPGIAPVDQVEPPVVGLPLQVPPEIAHLITPEQWAEFGVSVEDYPAVQALATEYGLDFGVAAAFANLPIDATGNVVSIGGTIPVADLLGIVKSRALTPEEAARWARPDYAGRPQIPGEVFEAYQYSQYYTTRGLNIPKWVTDALGGQPPGFPSRLEMEEGTKRLRQAQEAQKKAPQVAMGALEEIYQAQLPKVPAQQQFYKNAISDIYSKFEQAISAGQYPAPTDVKAKEKQWEEFLGQYPFREEYLQLPVEQRERPSQFAPRTRWLDF